MCYHVWMIRTENGRFASRLNADEIAELYCSGQTLVQIARRLGVTEGAILYHLRRANVPRRKRGPHEPSNKLSLPTNEIVRLYQSGLSTFDIARHLNCAGKTISDRLARAGCPTRRRGDYKGLNSGPNNANWRGGRSILPSGYVQVTSPIHKRGRDFEHRVVMSRVLGRPLTRDEHVHHLNGIRDDNRPSNLVVLDASTHKREGWTLVKALQQRVRELESAY